MSASDSEGSNHSNNVAYGCFDTFLPVGTSVDEEPGQVFNMVVKEAKVGLTHDTVGQIILSQRADDKGRMPTHSRDITVLIRSRPLGS